MIKNSMLLIGVLIPFFLFAQKKEKNTYICKAIDGIMVDGDSSDWKSNLYTENSELWSFASAINDGKLYAIALISDTTLIQEAIRGGVVLNISYSNKRKDGARLVFPVPNLERLEKLYGKSGTKKIWTNEQLLESAIGYSVTGFSKIVNGLLSFDNTYGIRAICKFSAAGDLIYEAVVPLEFIKFETQDVAIELAINTKYAEFKRLQSTKRSVQPSPMYSRKRPVKEVVTNPYKERVDIWFNACVK